MDNYRLVCTNPIFFGTANIQIEQFRDGTYDLYQGNYILTIWNEKLGIIKYILSSQSNLTIDCNKLQSGIYHLVLFVDGDSVCSKMLIL